MARARHPPVSRARRSFELDALTLRSWEHYLIHQPEPHILLFKRERDYGTVRLRRCRSRLTSRRSTRPSLASCVSRPITLSHHRTRIALPDTLRRLPARMLVALSNAFCACPSPCTPVHAPRLRLRLGSVRSAFRKRLERSV